MLLNEFIEHVEKETVDHDIIDLTLLAEKEFQDCDRLIEKLLHANEERHDMEEEMISSAISYFLVCKKMRSLVAQDNFHHSDSPLN